MRQDYEKIFANLGQIEPPVNLGGAIMARIAQRKIRAARIRLAFLCFAALASFVSIIPAFQYAFREFYGTGFGHYLSLMFSDGAILLAYRKEFVLLLAESLPALGITLFLAAVLASLSFLKLAAINIKTAFLRPIH